MNTNVKKIVIATLKENLAITIGLILFSLLVVISGLIPPVLLQRAIDLHLMVGQPKGLLELGLLYIGVLFLIGLSDFLKSALLTQLGQKIVYRLRSEALRKLHQVNARYFTRVGSGETVSKILNDVEAVDVLFTGGIVTMLIDLLKILGITLAIFGYSQRIGILTLVLIPILGLITYGFQKRMKHAQRQSRDLIGKLTQHVAETLENFLVIKANGKEYNRMKGFRNELSRLYRTNESINLYDSLYPTTIQIVRALTISVLVGSFLIDSTWMTIGIGSIAAMIELLSNLFEPIESAGSELQSLQQALAAIDRIDEFFGEEPQSPQNQELKQDEIRVDELTFHNVSFAYEADQPVLKNVELKLHRGQRVTFVGRTGVGKSTLLKLVLGLIVPDEGQIQLNGIDVHTIPDRLRRSIYGYVDQNFPIIDGTLRQQITLGDETISDQQILKALSDVGLNELVSEHPKGLDAKINQELSLSEGQKQLIAIARAIVTDAPILLLDEISSVMDGSTESEIDQVLGNIANQRIILSVSHRLTMLEEEDNVVILMDGKIKNQGKVRDLLVEDVWFSQTMRMQKQKLNVL